MLGAKKLQVFVSSTYTDLQEERQAAVAAILTAGHIPAGMELFAAGDESQMIVIKRWIDESDVYMLILGGRYGSIEPSTQKSYTHLEYEYAVAQGKALFAVVTTENSLDERVSKRGRSVLEPNHPQKLKEFRELVTSKLVEFWGDPRDIQIAIFKTMSEFSRRDSLTGWIPGSEAVNAGPLAEEIARLTKENAELRVQLQNFQAQATPVESASFNGLTFSQMYKLLSATDISLPPTFQLRANDAPLWQRVRSFSWELVAAGEPLAEEKLLHAVWILRRFFNGTGEWLSVPYLTFVGNKLNELHLMAPVSWAVMGMRNYQLNNVCEQFLLRLMLEPKFTEAATQAISDTEVVEYFHLAPEGE